MFIGTGGTGVSAPIGNAGPQNLQLAILRKVSVMVASVGAMLVFFYRKKWF